MINSSPNTKCTCIFPDMGHAQSLNISSLLSPLGYQEEQGQTFLKCFLCAWHCPECFTHTHTFSLLSSRSDSGNIITSILQVKKRRPREVKQLAKASQLQVASQDLNPGSMTPGLCS